MTGRDHDGAVEVLVDGIRIRVGHTALERYGELVRPMLEGDALVEDLSRIADSAGTIRHGSPEWLDPSLHGDGAELFLMFGDDIAFPLVESDDFMVAVTCVQHGGLTATMRVRRNEKHHFKRSARNVKRKGLPKRRPPRRGGDADEQLP